MPRQTRAGHGGGCSDGRASRRTRPLASVASLAAVGLALGIAAPAGAQPAEGGAFLDAQAASGRTAYGRSCASCHGTTLRGAVHGPDLTGPSFLSNWGSQTAAALYEYVRAEMPPGLGGSVPSGTYLSIVAYLLQVNGHAAGPQALTADAVGLVGEPGAAPARGAPATADASDAALADEPRDVDAVPALRGFVNREVSGLTPVTDELLRNPPAEDWLTWRRTRDNQGYTPLDRIGPDNVAGLRLAWALAMPEGTNQTAPLVHDGVMFLASPGNIVQALDAATGEVLWEHRHEYPGGRGELGRDPQHRPLPGQGLPDHLRRGDTSRSTPAPASRSGRRRKADYRKGFAQTAGPSHRQRRRRQRHQRLRAVRGRGLLHHRPRPGHRRGALAHVVHRPAG